MERWSTSCRPIAPWRSSPRRPSSPSSVALDVVVLASGSAARSLASHGGAADALVLCIGPKTAAVGSRGRTTGWSCRPRGDLRGHDSGPCAAFPGVLSDGIRRPIDRSAPARSAAAAALATNGCPARARPRDDAIARRPRLSALRRVRRRSPRPNPLDARHRPGLGRSPRPPKHTSWPRSGSRRCSSSGSRRRRIRSGSRAMPRTAWSRRRFVRSRRRATSWSL